MSGPSTRVSSSSRVSVRSTDGTPPKNTPAVESTTILGEVGSRRLQGEQGIMSDPGFRLDADVVGHLGGREISTGERTDANRVGLPERMTADGGVRLRSTWRVDPNRSRSNADAATLTVGVNGTADLAAVTSGVVAASSLVQQSADIYAHAQELYREVGNLVQTLQSSPHMGTLQGLREKVMRGERLSEADIRAAQEATNGLNAQLLQAQDIIGRLNRTFKDTQSMVRNIERGGLSVRAAALTRGYVEEVVGVRTPTLRVGKHRFDAAASVHLVQPVYLSSDAQQTLDGLQDLVRVRSAMLSVRAYLDVNLQGLRELDQVLGDARDVLGDVDRGLAATKKNVASGVSGLPSLGSNVRELISSSTELSDSLASAADSLAVEMSAGVEVIQPTAKLGGGLQEVSVRWRYNPSEHFALAVRGYVENVFGFLPSERTRLALDLESQSMKQVSREQINGYSTFFPRIYGVDVAAKTRRNSPTGTDVLVGVATDGEAVGAHLGLVQYLGSHLALQLGVVDPNVAAKYNHVIHPQAGVQVGLGRRMEGMGRNERRVNIALSGGPVAAVSGPDKGVKGGQAGLSFEVRFGRSK